MQKEATAKPDIKPQTLVKPIQLNVRYTMTKRKFCCFKRKKAV